MRAHLIAMVLLMSSALVPAIAQDREHSPASDQSETTPVQPERSPRRSEQWARKIGSRLRMFGLVAIGGPNSAMATAWGKWIKTMWAA